MIRKIIGATFALCLLALSACNTVHGVGQDLESGGRAIQRTANR